MSAARWTKRRSLALHTRSCPQSRYGCLVLTPSTAAAGPSCASLLLLNTHAACTRNPAYQGDCIKVTRSLPTNSATPARHPIAPMQGFHDAGYVHGDVKPGNFVLVEPSCFIAASMPGGGLKAVDVGCSQVVAPESGRLSRRAGTPVFMAPEVGMCRAVHAWECETRSACWSVVRRGS